MKKRIFAFLSTILLISAIVTPASATISIFTVKVSDAAATAGEDRVAVDILLQDNPGIAGFSFCVNYDTEKLVLVEAEIHIETGYKVIAQPAGYGVNLAWTGAGGYSESGKIATLYFNIPKDLTDCEADVEIAFREGYDSFYDAHEHDIAIETLNGKVAIEAHQDDEKPSVNIGGVFAGFGVSDVIVPITVQNNPGIAGFSFCINYDTSRLVLNSAEIMTDGGYKVVGYPEGYGVNVAWTSTDAYTENGTIVQLHFSLKNDPNPGKAYISAAFRTGYDSFYSFSDGTEKDIHFDVFSGYVDISNHQFGDWVITTPATCTATGLKTRTCSDCSKTETVVIPKADHEYVAVVTAPTCTEKGFTTYTCKTCSDFYIDSYVDTVDHTPGQWEQSIAPECLVKGEEVQKCTVCKAVLDTRTVDETGHDFGEWFEVTAPKFDEEGQERRNCKNCQHYETQTIPKLSESHVCSFTGAEEMITEPSCTEGGSKKVYCNVTECGKYTVVDVAPTGHTEDDWIVIQEPTCTLPLIKGAYCTICHNLIWSETLPVPGHWWIDNWYVYTEATFTADGEERRDCYRGCGEFQTRRIPMLSESHVCDYTGREEIIVDATCTENGSRKVFCTETECGKYEIVEIPAYGHKLGQWYTVTEPTFDTDGEQRRDCGNCDYYETNDLPKLSEGHVCDFTGREEVVQAATCTKSGTKNIYCYESACGKYTTVTVDPTGHSGGVWFVIVAPTATTTGLKARICDTCGETETVVVETLEHDYVIEVVPPTCTEEGYTIKTCTVCGASETYDYVPATGHSWSAWIQTAAPTCVKEGMQIRFCNCGSQETQSIPVLGHSWSAWIQTAAPTCINDGSQIRFCNCGTQEMQSVAALGHSFTNYISNNDATSKADGTKTAKCDRCDATDTQVDEGSRLGVVASGTCGETVFWALTEDGILEITGTGPMQDFTYDSTTKETDIPWIEYTDRILRIEIGSGVTAIGKTAFRSCENLTCVQLSDTITVIGGLAFWLCPGLTDIDIPESVHTIGGYAFYKCTGLTNMVFPSGLTQIGNSVCYQNTSLQSVTIPAGVTSIGTSAFRGCSALKDVYFGGTQTQWESITVGTNNAPLSKATIHVVQEKNTIAEHPVSVAVDSGETVQFTVTTTGLPVSFKWQYRKVWKWFDTTMEGYDTATLTVSATGARNGYDYRCVIIFADGTELISEPAELTVNTYITDIQNPNDQTVVLGYKGQFTAAATGESIKYQWEYKRPDGERWIETAMEGATKPTVYIESTTARDGYQYRCRITDVTGQIVYTEPATMRVLSVKEQPQEAFAPTGGTAHFTVVTNVDTGFSYQWQYSKNGTTWSNTTMEGYNTATLTVSATKARNGYLYRCILTGSKNSKLYSDSAVLHVSDPVVITAQPGEVTAAIGETAVFHVTATNAYTYQWQYARKGSDTWQSTSLTGAATDTLSVPVIASRNGYRYRCVITGMDGIVYYTDEAILTVG